MARTLQATVVADANNKTAVVAVATSRRHPLYDKRYTQTKKFHVHDEQNSAKIGDTVLITEARRRSKRKAWEIVKVTEKSS